VLLKLLGFLVVTLQDLRRVRFRSHRAFFQGSPDEKLFLTVTNLSRTREIEITHVWVAGSKQVHALPAERPLPKRLRPDEIWETWVTLGSVAEADLPRILKLGRARLSTGRIVRSLPDAAIPGVGFVPGGSKLRSEA